ncbi:hypothetical protein J4429_00810 [Candidatus Pacearchaeota archaeon]|nr:hypothetical protein [Candidatus Pacearchaeota archaeon]
MENTQKLTQSDLYYLMQCKYGFDESRRRIGLMYRTTPNNRINASKEDERRVNLEAEALLEVRDATKIIGRAVADLINRGYNGANIARLKNYARRIAKEERKKLNPYRLSKRIDLYFTKRDEEEAFEAYTDTLRQIGAEQIPEKALRVYGEPLKGWPKNLTRGTNRAD